GRSQRPRGVSHSLTRSRKGGRRIACPLRSAVRGRDRAADDSVYELLLVAALVARVQRVLPGRDLVAIAHTVTVGVGVGRIGSDGDLIAVFEAVTVRICIVRVASDLLHLVAVAQAVTVGVRVIWIGAVFENLFTVRQSIAISVRVVWIGVEPQAL